MRKQARDVVGDWSSMIPGVAQMNYVLGIMTVPIEAFLRRNFGERYFTTANFFAGGILLFSVQLIGNLLTLLNPLSWLGTILGHGGASAASWMGVITKYYFYVGGFHFLRIWWNNVVGTPKHSFSAGRSWLRPVGQAVMFVLNPILNAVVKLIFEINPKLDKRRLEIALPVLQDVDTFTERYIEPAFVLFIGFIAASAGQTMVFVWLGLSAMALNLYTGMRHEQERNYVLDIQDSLIEASYIQQSDEGGSEGKKSYDRMVKRMVFEVEKNPDAMPTIEGSYPNLAEALKAMNPKLRKTVNDNPFDSNHQQAA